MSAQPWATRRSLAALSSQLARTGWGWSSKRRMYFHRSVRMASLGLVGGVVGELGVDLVVEPIGRPGGQRHEGSALHPVGGRHLGHLAQRRVHVEVADHGVDHLAPREAPGGRGR